MAVTLLDAVADTGATSIPTLMGSFSVSAGNDRILYAITAIESSDARDVPDLSWGGQPMTELIDALNETGFDIRLQLWALNEADIAAGSGTAFASTGSSAGGTYRCLAFSVTGALQTLALNDSDQDTTSPSGTALSVDAVAGGIAVAVFAANNVTNISWTGITEVFEFDSGQTISVGFDTTSSASTLSITPTDDGSGGAGPASFAVTVAPSTPTISLLDAWQALADDGSTFVPSAGTNRVVLVAAHEEGADTDITGGTYGDQALRAGPLISSPTATFRSTGALFAVNEADLAAATGTAITINEDSTPQVGNVQIFVATFENVDQETIFFDQDSASADPGSAAGVTIDTDTDGFAIAIAGSGAVDDITWALPFIEQLEEDDDSSTGSVAHVATDGTSVTATPSFTAANRSILAAVSLRRFVVLTSGEGEADLTFGGAVDETFIQAGSSASADLTFGETVNESVEVAAAASASIVLATIAEGGRIVSVSASADLLTATTAEGLRLNLVDASTAFAFSTDADASPFLGLNAQASLTFTTSATALIPPPPPPETALADSFAVAQRPAVLVDLFFDEGEVNIWTRPVSGIFNNKQYNPLAGVTSGITVRNSLDDSSLDVSVQLSGQSDELLNLALTSNFQRRRAVVRLANLDANFEVESEEILIIGTISNMPITDSAEESTVSVLIDSVFRDVNRPRVLRLSAADQALINGDDSFFNFTETDAVEAQRFGGS